MLFPPSGHARRRYLDPVHMGLHASGDQYTLAGNAQCCQFHFFCCFIPSSTNPSNNGEDRAVSRLCRFSPRRDSYIQSKQNGTSSAQRCILPQRIQSKKQSRGYFFLLENKEDPANNGAVLNTAQIIKAVMSSAAEAELGAMFINAREAVPCRKTLQEMGHKQPRTPMQIDNSTAIGVANKC